MLGSELTTGHEVGLVIVAAIFIAFALASSFVAPKIRPDFPGPRGLSTFIIVSVVLFALMVLAVNFFG